MTMTLGQWFSKLKPVIRGLAVPGEGDRSVLVPEPPAPAHSSPPADDLSLPSDGPPSPAPDAVGRDGDAAVPLTLDALRESVESLHGRQAELGQQVDHCLIKLDALFNGGNGDDDAVGGSLPAIERQIEGVRLQHESLLASMQESSAATGSHGEQLERLRTRLDAAEGLLGAFHDVDLADLREQLLHASKVRTETDAKFAELAAGLRKLQNTMTGVLQSAEVAREAYLARDNARILESQRDRKALWALVGVSLLLAGAALLIALRALGMNPS